MEGHQYVAVIHRDTDNVHVHVAANRINPVTYRAATLSFSKEKLHRCCRELELRYGFTPDNGSWIRDENNQVMRAKKSTVRCRMVLSAWSIFPIPKVWLGMLFRIVAIVLMHYCNRKSLSGYRCTKF